MRYLLFGASTTFGETDYTYGGWAGRLREYLDAREQHCYFHNLAVSGDTTKDLLARIAPEAKARIRNKPKEEWTLFLSIGTNDSRLENGQPKVAEDEYRHNTEQLIAISQSLVGTVVIIGSHPVIEARCNPWRGSDIHFLNDRIVRYDTIKKEAAAAAGILFVDTLAAYRNAHDFNEQTDDGLHPNEQGHAFLFAVIKKELAIWSVIAIKLGILAILVNWPKRTMLLGQSIRNG